MQVERAKRLIEQQADGEVTTEEAAKVSDWLYDYAEVFATCAKNGIMYSEAVTLPMKYLIWLYNRFSYEHRVEMYISSMQAARGVMGSLGG